MQFNNKSECCGTFWGECTRRGTRMFNSGTGFPVDLKKHMQRAYEKAFGVEVCVRIFWELPASSYKVKRVRTIMLILHGEP